MIFETHAHYDDEKFDEDRAELLSSMQENGIGRIINVSANLESLENTRKLMEAYPFIYGAFGLHPDEVGDLNEDVMARMRELCRMEKAVAVGEIGLDYYWDKENHEKQEYWFRRQIALAREEKLPMIIHSREAAADTLRVMKEEKSEEIGGVIHCFSYSVEMAEEYLKMGFYLGIGGYRSCNLRFRQWRRGDVQKCKEDQRSGSDGSDGAHSAGNRQSVSGTGSVPGKTKFFSVSAVRGAGDRRAQGNFGRRSH